jgi:glycosyltransferase involved in cell wall biosynthesis
MTRDLAEGLTARGHDITVLGVAIRLPNQHLIDEMRNGVRVVLVPRASLRWPAPIRDRWHRWRLRRALEKLHRESPFDLVESPDYQGWVSHGPLPSVPLLLRIHGSNFFFDAELNRKPNHLEHRCEHASVRRATHLAAPSAYAARRHLELAGLDRPCEVIPNCVDTGLFCPDENLEPEPELILYVNSLNPKKGIEQLIDAANDLLPRRPGARLVVVGGDNMRALHGRYLEQLRERVAPELRARVEFAGRLPREQVVDWLRRAAVCVFPSHMETFGIAPAEAMAVGKATIFTKLGPGSEIITDGEDGLLCDPRDPADIARCIVRFLDDIAFAERVGKAAREKVLRTFDKRGWIARNVEFYERCIRDMSAGAN